MFLLIKVSESLSLRIAFYLLGYYQPLTLYNGGALLVKVLSEKEEPSEICVSHLIKQYLISPTNLLYIPPTALISYCSVLIF